jgi:predicted secreted protein
MAFRHGKNAVFKVDNSSASLTDISTYCDSVQLPRSIATAETTTFGVTGGAKTYITGLSDSTVSISGKWDSALDAVLAGVVGQDTLLNWNYGPGGSTTGYVKFTGSAILTKYSVDSPVGDVVKFSADFQVSGPVTRTTW